MFGFKNSIGYGKYKFNFLPSIVICRKIEMPPKNIRKTIKVNPLDALVSQLDVSKKIATPKKNTSATKITSVKIKNPPKNQAIKPLNSAPSIDKGKKKMDNSINPGSQNLSAQDVSAEDILDKAITPEATKLEGDIKLDYRHELAKNTVSNSAQWATAAGFIPFSFVDTAAIAALQLKMVHDLCQIYQTPFKKEVVVGIIASVTGGSLTTFGASKIAEMGIRNIPYIGSALSLVTQPALSYATTYALGMLFISHFEGNGVLANMNVDSAKKIFDQQYDMAKHMYHKQMASAKSLYHNQVTKARKLFSKNISSDPVASSSEASSVA
jgi:uncharacterized protein (DUF697 family)